MFIFSIAIAHLRSNFMLFVINNEANKEKVEIDRKQIKIKINLHWVLDFLHLKNTHNRQVSRIAMNLSNINLTIIQH